MTGRHAYRSADKTFKSALSLASVDKNILSLGKWQSFGINHHGTEIYCIFANNVVEYQPDLFHLQISGPRVPRYPSFSTEQLFKQ